MAVVSPQVWLPLYLSLMVLFMVLFTNINFPKTPLLKTNKNKPLTNLFWKW